MPRTVLTLTLTLLTATTAAAPLEDPMRPPGQPASASAAPVERAPELVLTSVLIGPARRVAVINGTALGVGASVGGARVVAITPSRVTLERAGRTAELTLLDLQVKELAKAGEP